MRATWSVLVLVTAAAACSETSPRSAESPRTDVDTVGGVLQVRSSGDAPRWRLEPVLRLGSVEGRAEEFGRIRSLVADVDRNVDIADNLTHEIRVFAPDGGHLRTIGRRGEGLGEFGDLYSLAWLGEDLVAMDPANARMALFSRQGEWLGSIEHFPITGPASSIRLYPLGSEGFYAPVIDPNRPGLPFYRVTTTGSGDTIPAPQRPEEASSTSVPLR